MPIVTIQVIEGATQEQKTKLVQGVTALVHEVLAKDPNRIYVVINEVPFDNWAAGGVTVTQRREQGIDGICQCGAHDRAGPTP